MSESEVLYYVLKCGKKYLLDENYGDEIFVDIQ